MEVLVSEPATPQIFHVVRDVTAGAHHADEPDRGAEELGQHVRDPRRVVIGEHHFVVVSERQLLERPDGRPVVRSDPLGPRLEHDHPSSLTLHLDPQGPGHVGG
jgi:hypothetical protein